MSGFWQGLSQREKYFIIGGATIIGLFGLIQIIIMPIFNWRHERQRSISQAENFYELAVQASASSSSAATIEADLTTPVRNVISSTAPSRGIVLDFVNARDDGSVEVSIGNISTDDLYGWFSDLEKKFSITLVSADVARSPEAEGTANARLVFSRAAL